MTNQRGFTFKLDGLSILGIALIALLSFGSRAVHAAVTMTVTGQTAAGFAGITAWPSPPTVDTTALAPTPGAYVTVPEDNLGSSDFDPTTNFDYSFGQSFVATTSGKLTKIQFPFTGDLDSPHTFQLSVYDGLDLDWTDISIFDPTMTGTPDPYRPGIDVSNNLITDTSFKNWAGYTVMGTTHAVMDFSLTGTDQVDIVAGKTYIVEFLMGENPLGNFLVGRNGAGGDNSTNYTDGQAFRSREPLNGNAMRDIAMSFTIESASPALPGDFDEDDDVDGRDFLIWQRGGSPTSLSAEDLADWQENYGQPGPLVAISAVPEPSSIVLFALAFCVGGLRRRS